MQASSERARSVRVPASTSNLGPGFDALGLALDLDLEIRATPLEGAREHELVLAPGEAAHWPRDLQDNLMLKAFERARDALGGSGCMRFEVTSQVPIGRGLGSSGAAIAGGLLLAHSFAGSSASRDELFALGLELEGHPDNVAPALFGGCVLCVPRAAGAARPVALEIHPRFAFAVAWPAATLSTEFARSLLPAEVRLSEAADGARRLAALIEGLRRGDDELVACAELEHLHVPHRLPHIPAGAAALGAAREAGAVLATISGSGTALFAISTRERAEAVSKAMGNAFQAAGAGGAARVVHVAHEAPAVSCD